MGAANEYYDKVLKVILEENGLKIKRVPEGQYALMRAISNCLYFTSVHHAKIQKMCVDYVVNSSDREVGPPHQLSDKLRTFRASTYLFKDFCDNPSLPSFENTNMEIVSAIFRLEVKIYTIGVKQIVLQCNSINNTFTSALRILKSKDTHFDSLFPDDRFINLGFCQNIVLNLINEVIGPGENEWRDMNRDKYVNIEFEQWRKFSQEPSSPKKERKATAAKGNPPKDELQSNFSQSDAQKTMKRQEATSREKTYNIFKTDAKTEKSKEREFFQNFNTIHPLKKLQSRTERKEGSILADIENNVNLKIHELDGTNSESFNLGNSTSNKNSSSVQSSPENHLKRLDMFDKEIPLSDMQQYNFGSMHESPKRTGIPIEYFTAPKYQSVFPMASNGQPLITYLQQDNAKRSTLPPGLDMSTNTAPQELAKPNPALNSSFDESSKKKPLDESKRYTGRLKFFDEAKNYGFIVMDEDGSDIFVHYDDLLRANLSKELLRTAKKGNYIKLSFSCFNYIGKHKHSKKAVDLQLVPN